MSLLTIENLSAYYGKAKALHDFSVSVEQGSTIAIVGANGAGKSTLLDSIMGLTTVTGSIVFDGQEISSKKPQEIVALGLGYR